MKRYILFTAALLTLAACNKDETGPEGSSIPVEIRLTSSLEAQTRATHGLDTQLAAGETVHVWVDDAGLSEDAVLYENNIYNVEETGALTLSEGETMYFPTSGNAVNIYGIHGNLDSDLASFWGTEITHTVATDQQSSVTAAGEGYAVSDLVYCESTGINRSKDAVTLSFKHLLSKVEIVLVQGDGNPEITKAEILNTQLQATFTPAKGSEFEVTAVSNTTGTILIDNGITAADAEELTLNEAVIVPQTLVPDTQFIRLTAGENNEMYFELAAITTFEAGKRYRYTITASLTGLDVTAEIGEWDSEVSSYSVNAELD